MKFRFQDNRGSALVELALTTPLFLFLIAGSIEFGRVAYYAIEVANAARAGASYGSVNVGNADQTASIEQAAKNDAPDLPVMNATATSACVCETVTHNTDGTSTQSFNPSSGTASCTTSTTISSCTEDDSVATQYVIKYVSVSTSASINRIFSFAGLPRTYTVYGSSQLRTLQN